VFGENRGTSKVTYRIINFSYSFFLVMTISSIYFWIIDFWYFFPHDDYIKYLFLNHQFLIFFFLMLTKVSVSFFINNIAITYACGSFPHTRNISREMRPKIYFIHLQKSESRESRHRCENRFYPYSRCVLVRRISSLMHSQTPWFPRYFTLKSNERESRNVYVRRENVSVEQRARKQIQFPRRRATAKSTSVTSRENVNHRIERLSKPNRYSQRYSDSDHNRSHDSRKSASTSLA